MAQLQQMGTFQMQKKYSSLETPTKARHRFRNKKNNYFFQPKHYYTQHKPKTITWEINLNVAKRKNQELITSASSGQKTKGKIESIEMKICLHKINKFGKRVFYIYRRNKVKYSGLEKVKRKLIFDQTQ